MGAGRQIEEYMGIQQIKGIKDEVCLKGAAEETEGLRQEDRKLCISMTLEEDTSYG